MFKKNIEFAIKILSIILVSTFSTALFAANENSLKIKNTLSLAPELIQQAYIKASNTGSNDLFGTDVALYGDTMVVSSFFEASNSQVDQANNNANEAGAVYVFVRSDGIWTQQAYLKASNIGAGDHFGSAIALYGDTLVVGAKGEQSNATGINGNQLDNSIPNAGAAYVFIRNNGIWTQEAYLKSSNNDLVNGFGDLFGHAVTIYNNTIVVSAVVEDSNTTGINAGGQDDNSSIQSGAVYVFTRTDSTWSQQAYIKSSNNNAGDRFGASVALLENRLVIGANGEDSNGANAPNNNSANESGAIYVFDRIGSTWSQQAYIKASNPETSDNFGSQIAISGDTIVVGAYLEDSGIPGTDSDNSSTDSGAVYVFKLSGSIWNQEAYIKSPNIDDTDYFGFAVDIDGDRIVIGSIFEDSNSTGIDSTANNLGSDTGAAYIYTRNNGVWSLEHYLKGPIATEDNLYFGTVAINNNTIIIGSQGESSNSTGVNGDFENTSSLFSGATFVFDLFYSVNGSISGLADGSNFTLQNNLGDDLLIDTNGNFSFDTKISNNGLYAVSVLIAPSAPNQLCLVTGGNSTQNDGSGSIMAANETSIEINCNTEPTAVADNYIINEDNILIGTNLTGILVNDSDIETDPLHIQNPGTFNMTGIGGLLSLSEQGTFTYIPPENQSGEDTFVVNISDGFQTKASVLTITVLPVNDAPAFSITGDVDASMLLDPQNTTMQIAGFASNFVFGPIDENTQAVSQFNISVFSDFNSVLNSVSISNIGTLDLDFSLNYGVAIIKINLQDNGLTENGGNDTSDSFYFIVAYTDADTGLIFKDGFEIESSLKLFNYIDSIKTRNINSQWPTYDFESDSLIFYKHQLFLNNDYDSPRIVQIAQFWLNEILKLNEVGGEMNSKQQ